MKKIINELTCQCTDERLMRSAFFCTLPEFKYMHPGRGDDEYQSYRNSASRQNRAAMGQPKDVIAKINKVCTYIEIKIDINQQTNEKSQPEANQKGSRQKKARKK